MKKSGCAALLAATLAATPAAATDVIDPAGDFGAIRAGSHNPDLDAASIAMPGGNGSGRFRDLISPASNFASPSSTISIATQRVAIDRLPGDARVIKSRALVPEPAGWALLIAGFGLTGATLRRRRGSIASVTA